MSSVTLPNGLTAGPWKAVRKSDGDYRIVSPGCPHSSGCNGECNEGITIGIIFQHGRAGANARHIAATSPPSAASYFNQARSYD